MAKKKEQLEDVVFDTPKLTATDYWEWRTTIAEFNDAKSKLELNETRLKLLQKDVELSMVKQQLHAATLVRSSRESADSAKAEYHRFKKVLEEKLGRSLDNCVIDDVTFEVKTLESTTNN
jgi:hypothetical protein